MPLAAEAEGLIAPMTLRMTPSGETGSRGAMRECSLLCVSSVQLNLTVPSILPFPELTPRLPTQGSRQLTSSEDSSEGRSWT